MPQTAGLTESRSRIDRSASDDPPCRAPVLIVLVIDSLRERHHPEMRRAPNGAPGKAW